MLPTKFTGEEPEEDRKLWKIVRRDTFADVPGLIMSADVQTGSCSLKTLVPGGDAITKHEFGADGLRIVPAKR